MAGARWWPALSAAVVLALVSLASIAAVTSRLPGEGIGLLTAFRSVSEVLNAGVVWAGLAVLSGWLARRPLHGSLMGVVASLTALVVHYGAGRLLGVYAPAIWAENAAWFAIAAVAGGPLGVVGAVARSRGPLGLPARLTVPVGALLEPFVRGGFTVSEHLPWPDRVSGALSGSVLVAAGVAGSVVVVVGATRAPRRTRPRWS
ncbi:hypothetical protein GTR02_02605 [Kineococcus sp. R8]|uniref:hypothetical protein n=1 Tax=Kineococcus siccus TaxID=2696567 RepID=UPI00141246DC|nr:hypothetical protein [Kineococcus siccus]NAZ80709.1 hypothetical protein [Kineococcus siccus]